MIEQLYGYNIRVYDTRYCNGRVIEVLRWTGYQLQQFAKWKWYFEYRYALLRVKYPKNCIEHGEFKMKMDKKTAAQILKDKIRSKKRNITVHKNKLKAVVDNWNELWPIEEHPLYQKVVAKIKRLENELAELESLKNQT